jgi:toxin ParE1/3/4
VSAKPIVPRKRANQDVDGATAHHLTEGAQSGALGLVNALQDAYARLGGHPAIGSPRYARAEHPRTA